MKKKRIKNNYKGNLWLSDRRKKRVISFFIVFAMVLVVPLTVTSALQQTRSQNFAATGSYVISGTIWLDTGDNGNPDGIWNNNEVVSTFTNVPIITLHNAHGQTWQTTPTQGAYSFHNLTAGTYSISITGFTPTNPGDLRSILVNANNPIVSTVNIGYYMRRFLP